jgi:flagellar basal-body rod modification protein FlgD
MTTIRTVNTGSPAASSQATTGANGQLGKDDFLKLFVAQLQHQDPMSPMENSDFMGQMASFSSLEQISNLAMVNERTSAIGLIGRTVTYKDAKNVLQTGTVDKVTTVDGKPSLTVAGVDGIDPATITQVA